MTSQALYQQPVLLNRQKHKNVRFTPQKDLRFTQAINSVPVNGIEFFAASRELPVLFSLDKNGQYFPVALLSLGNNGHHLLTEKGTWMADVYLPAFLRRYPFIISSKGGVCIDSKAPHFASKETGELLLEETGEYSPALKSAITFLHRFEKQNQDTREYMAACQEAGLLKPCSFGIRQGKNKVVRLDGLFIIDEAKLARLPEDKIVQWHNKGWLAWSYAQIHSMGSLQRLLQRQKAYDKAAAAN